MHRISTAIHATACRTLTAMNGIPHRVEIQLTSDALAFHVGQEVMLRQLIVQENAQEVSSLVLINRLRAQRDKVRERISEAGIDALVAQGVDRELLLRAEIRVVQEDEDSVTIFGIAHLSVRDP